MTFIEAISRALADYAGARRDAKAKKTLVEDPFSPGLIKRIADEYGYNWRIIRYNGDVIEFTKPINEAESTTPSW